MQGGSAEADSAWPPLPSKLTLLGIAYDSGSIRICSGVLLELMHLSPAQLAKLGLSAGGGAAEPPDFTSQVQFIACKSPSSSWPRKHCTVPQICSLTGWGRRT